MGGLGGVQDCSESFPFKGLAGQEESPCWAGWLRVDSWYRLQGLRDRGYLGISSVRELQPQ